MLYKRLTNTLNFVPIKPYTYVLPYFCIGIDYILTLINNNVCLIFTVHIRKLFSIEIKPLSHFTTVSRRVLPHFFFKETYNSLI